MSDPDPGTPLNLCSWFCHIGMFHAYLTKLLESMQIQGYFKPKARRVWAEGLRILADMGASLLRPRGTTEAALAYTNTLSSVADLVKDLKLNSGVIEDISNETFRRWVGNAYDPTTPTNEAHIECQS
jgi:hypothetical protein